jgi:alanyl aminopeptidase
MTNPLFRQAYVCCTCVLLFIAGCSKPEPATTENDSQSTEATASAEIAPVGQLGNSVVPRHYRLELTIDPTEERFSGVVEIDVTFAESKGEFWLHGRDLDVTEAYLIDSESNRIDATYEQKLPSGVALVSLDQSIPAGNATLHVTYNAAFNTSTNSLFKVVRGEDSYAATQFEAIAARSAFPGFDEPVFKVPFDLSVVTRTEDVAITTTPDSSTEDIGGGYVRHIFETTRPMPTYLLAFAVGPYDLVDYGMIPANDIRGREVRLRGVAAKGLGGRMEYALENTEGLLSVLEDYFGRPYPYKKLDLIAVPESFGGAMENVGAITYDESLMLMDENSPISQRRAYTYVHAHEMAHMWFGNLVTPDWWTDIWLNESFATWMMYKTAHTYWPDGEFDRETLKGAIGAMASDSLATAREIREPIDHNDNISGAFDGITYQKGGGVLRMLERYVGEGRFQAGIQLHMDRHADSTANADDFISSLAEGTERTEIEAAFKSYIQQAGVPLLSVRVQCDESQAPRIEVSQARYAPLGSTIDPDASQWHVPMCVSFNDGEERKSSCMLLNEKAQTINLEASSCPTLVHPNADGAGYYRFAMDSNGWQALVDGADSLSAAEALSFADSLDAAFRGGDVSAESYLSGMAALVGHPAWDVADAATGHLESITSIIDDSDLEPVEAVFRDIARPRYEQLAGATDSGSQILQQRMQRFLIVMAKDEEMRAPLAELAAARIGLDGEADVSAAPASELETIFSIGVQDIGEPFFDLLLQQSIASEDPAFRDSANGALARVEDPVLVAKLQNALLSGDFKGTEFVSIAFRQLIRTATTDLTYEWLKENYDSVLELLPESFRTRIVAAVGGAFCSTSKSDDWEAFVIAHAETVPGYERSLAQASEGVQLCAALKEASARELLAAFENYH